MPWTNRGIVYPALTDTVKPASRDLKDLAQTTTTAITDAQNTAQWDRGKLAAGTDLDSITAEGGYQITTYALAEGTINRPSLPTAINPAKLAVYSASGTTVVQEWRTTPANGVDAPIMQRVRGNDGVWSQWRRTDSQLVYRSVIRGEDVHGLDRSGTYRVADYAVATSLVNAPVTVEALGPAVVNVTVGEKGERILVWSSMRAVSDVSTVLWKSRDNGGRWSGWQPYGAGPMSLSTGDSLDTLIRPGSYTVPSYSVAAALLPQPYQVRNAVNKAVVRVLAGPGASVVQEWFTLPVVGAPAPILRRYRDETGTWSQFTEVPGGLLPPSGTSDADTGGAAVAVESDRRVRNRVLSMQITDRSTLPVWAWSAPAAAAPLTMPTHEGSGSVTHPSVRYIPGGWNGYTHWMAFTPYPLGNEAHEDPNIVASNDGVTWEVPGSLVNPLDNQSGKPDPYNSDTHLTWGPNGEMVCLWRMVDRPADGQEVMKWRTSTDGVTWTPAQEVFRIPLGYPYSSFVAPSLHWLGDRWRMYGITTKPNPNRLEYFETTVRAPTSADWSDPVMCAVGPQFSDRDWWHAEIQPDPDGGWYGIMDDVARGLAGVDGNIYLMHSDDGRAWDVSPIPLVPQVGRQHNAIYKSSLLAVGSGAARYYDVWYAAFHTRDRNHQLFKTTATPIL